MDGKKINLSTLIDNLNKQLSLYQELNEILLLEKKALIAVDIKEIRDITFNKEILLHELYLSEKSRIQWQNEVANYLNINLAELTLEKISHLANAEEKNTLTAIKTNLISIIEVSKELNLYNQKLTENALRESQVMKENALGITGDRSNTYGPKGSLGNNKESQTRFLSREA